MKHPVKCLGKQNIGSCAGLIKGFIDEMEWLDRFEVMVEDRSDFVLCNMPPATLRAPALGPALLMSIVRQNNYKAGFYDLNFELYESLKHVKGIEEIFFWGGVFDHHEEYKKYHERYFKDFISSSVEKLAKHQPRWIGLSMLTYHCELFLKDFLQEIRTRLPQSQIVIGGGFVDQVEKFRVEYFHSGLVDAYVSGEGEEAILALLRGEMDFPGINGVLQKDPVDLQAQVIPDYSDVDPQAYGFTAIEDEKRTPCVFLEGSRGCIQKCTFCTVPFLDKNYRHRDNQLIVDEMVEINRRHGIFRFQFTDSLINASRFRLEEFCELTAAYNEKNPDFGKAFRIVGNFIIRPKKFVPPEKFDLYARGGINSLTFGIESGSNDVRLHMKKRFSNDDVVHHVRECHRVGILSTLLFIVGYPTETEEDFLQTLQLLTDLKDFKEVMSLRVNWTTVINGLKNYLNVHFEDLGLTEMGQGHWRSNCVDPEISFDRYKRFLKHCDELGFEYRVKLDHGSIEDTIAQLKSASGS